MAEKKYKVPKPVYYQCIWLVKDVDRLRRLEAVYRCDKEPDELVFFVDDDEVIRSVDVLKQAAWKLECLRKAVQAVPEEYRKLTIDSILYGMPFGDSAHENTWRKWRQVFIRELAQNLMMI